MAVWCCHPVRAFGAEFCDASQHRTQVMATLDFLLNGIQSRKLYPQISAADATIIDIDCKMPHCQDAAKAEFTQLVRVSLAYRKINWEHTTAGTSGADDWRAPIEA